jgi:pentatricopeptide repeat protein
VRQMDFKDVRRTEVTYSTAIAGLARCGEWRDAGGLVRHMVGQVSGRVNGFTLWMIIFFCESSSIRYDSRIGLVLEHGDRGAGAVWGVEGRWRTRPTHGRPGQRSQPTDDTFHRT